MTPPRRCRSVPLGIAIIVALGVGANLAVTRVLRDVLIGAIPYADSQRLVVLENHGPYDLGVRKVSVSELSWPDFRDLAAQQHVFTAIGGVTGVERTLWDTGVRKRSVQRVFVTRDLFHVLGARARAGRTLTELDFAAGAPPTLLITASLWKAQLGSDPHAPGRTVHVDGQPFTLVGVIDDEVLSGVRERTALFERGDANECLVVPLVPGAGGRMERLLALRREHRGRPMLTLVGRLASGSSLERAQHEVRLLAQRLAAQYPDTNRSRTIEAVPLTERRTRAVERVQPMLLAVAALSWLAACASAAGLVFADAIRRQPEMAVRRALGASRWRLMRLILWRSLEWTVPGGLLGLALAHLAVMWIVPGAGSLAVVRSGPEVVAQTAGLTVLAGAVIAGLAAWVLFRQDLARGLREAAHPGLPGRRRRTLFAAVIAAHMAAATAVGLVCALLIGSMANILNVELGFDPGQTFSVRVFFPLTDADTPEQQSAFVDAALTQIRSLSNVASAGLSTTPPLSGVVVTSGGDYMLEAPRRSPQALGPLMTQYVSPGYFEAIGMRPTRGRGFRADDVLASSPVIVVDEAFCRQYLPTVDPLTAGIRMGGTLFHIAGVVRDVRPDGPTEDVRATLYALRDERQPRTSLAHFVVRPSQPVSAALQNEVVRALVALDRRVVVDEPQRLETLLADTLAHRRRALRLVVLASIVVVMLTAFSVSGALGEFVENKTGELAVRTALGAPPGATVLLLARYLAGPCLAGIALGSLGGRALAETLSSELVGIAPADLAAMGATVLGVCLVGTAAALGPLRRAFSIDPARALRSL